MIEIFDFLDLALLWAARILVGGALLAGVGAVIYAFVWGGQVHPDDKEKPLHLQRVMTGHWRPGYAVRWGTWIGLIVTIGPALGVVIYGIVTGTI